MSVTPAGDLAGVLPCVVSGGRPALKQRRTAQFLHALHGVTADPVWVVRDDHATDYEPDGHEIVTYPRGWAQEYAAAHWTAPEPFDPAGFLGSMTGREWACRTAEERGCWAYLQLDDNITQLKAFRAYKLGRLVAERHGGLALFADLLAAVTLATNSRMTGAFMDAVHPLPRELRTVARAGFPYSLFVEQVGEGREEYYGPAEDDILHAYQYASNGTTATAALVPCLLYKKDTQAQSGGMRRFYKGNTRAVGLQRAAPEMAKIRVMATTANGRGGPRVFHKMQWSAIGLRTPLRVTDRDLMAKVAAFAAELAAEVAGQFRDETRARVHKRAGLGETGGARREA